MYEYALEDTANVVFADSINGGMKAFRMGLTQNGNNAFAAIVLDGSLKDHESSVPLARGIRSAGYSGPLVANATLSDRQRELKNAGCDYESEFKDAPAVVRRLPAVNPHP